MNFELFEFQILTTAVDEGDDLFTISMTFALKGHTEYGDGGFHGLQRGATLQDKALDFKKKKILGGFLCT